MCYLWGGFEGLICPCVPACGGVLWRILIRIVRMVKTILEPNWVWFVSKLSRVSEILGSVSGSVSGILGLVSGVARVVLWVRFGVFG